MCRKPRHALIRRSLPGRRKSPASLVSCARSEGSAQLSEVLNLLSGSHGDLSRLFDAILTNATNLCHANFGTLYLYEGDAFRLVAQHNAPPAYAELREREPLV